MSLSYRFCNVHGETSPRMKCPSHAHFSQLTMKGESATICNTPATSLHQFCEQIQLRAPLAPPPDQQLSQEKCHQEPYTCPEGPCPVINPSNMLTNLLQKISAVLLTRPPGRPWAVTQFVAHRKAMGSLALTGASP